MGQPLSPTHWRSFLLQKGKSASRAEGELIVGGFGFPVRGCIPAGLDGREAGKMLPKQCPWVSMVLQSPRCSPAGSPLQDCAPGERLCPGTAGACAAGAAGMAFHSEEAAGAPSYGQSFRKSTFIFPTSEAGSARGRLMTHSTPEIIFMGIDP